VLQNIAELQQRRIPRGKGGVQLRLHLRFFVNAFRGWGHR
jgi:hypothetical protein